MNMKTNFLAIAVILLSAATAATPSRKCLQTKFEFFKDEDCQMAFPKDDATKGIEQSWSAMVASANGQCMRGAKISCDDTGLFSQIYADRQQCLPTRTGPRKDKTAKFIWGQCTKIDKNRMYVKVSGMAADLFEQLTYDAPSSVFRGRSPIESFKEMSPNNNPWTGKMLFGGWVGFLLFGITYLYTIIYIFYDINRTKKYYQSMIELDRNTMNQLNLSASMRETWAEELKYKILGMTKGNSNDDQLFGTAAAMTEMEWKEHVM